MYIQSVGMRRHIAAVHLADVLANMKVFGQSMYCSMEMKKTGKVKSLDHLPVGKPPIVEYKVLPTKYELVQAQKPVKGLTAFPEVIKAMQVRALNNVLRINKWLDLLKKAVKAKKQKVYRAAKKAKQDLTNKVKALINNPQMLADMMMAAKYQHRSV